MRAVHTGLLASLLLLGSGCIYNFDDDRYEDERYAFHGGPVALFVAHMEDASADFAITGRSGHDLEVHARLGSDDLDDLEAADVGLFPHGGTVELVFLDRHGDVHLRFADVRLPRDAAIDVTTGSGDVEIDGMDARVKAESGSGDLGVFTRGPVDLSTGSGNVRAGGTAGHVYTGSGDVVFDVDPAASGTLRLRTGSGDVRVVLPRGLGVRIDASTGSGEIALSAGGIHVVQEQRLDVTLDGGGDLVLEIDTSSGDVEIRD